MEQSETHHVPELIVMLTHNDHTVENASQIFDRYHLAKARYWGMKEDGIPFDEMKQLYAQMRECGKTTVLEVVEYTERECLKGAEMAMACECDILMGTMFFDSVNDLCRESGMRYMPFVGKISGRPSVLEGSVDDMIAEARECLSKGASGIDLLGYRYAGDAIALNQAFVSYVNAPVCLAGSVNSFKRLDEVKACAPWAFTIGGAFFENRFGDDFGAQIDKVCDYMAAS